MIEITRKTVNHKVRFSFLIREIKISEYLGTFVYNDRFLDISLTLNILKKTLFPTLQFMEK
jgi:hypothetical protein